MTNIRICNDLEEARRLWHRHWPQRSLFDLWGVRSCFQMYYDRDPWFVVAEQHDAFAGMLALSWIPELHCFGHFPGEVWCGKTWLEQNRILACSPEVVYLMEAHTPGEINIRYLVATDFDRHGFLDAVDEIGYLFYPGLYDYSFQNYMRGFSGKTRKKIRHEVSRLERQGVSYRFDHLPDIDGLFRLNLESFEDKSYFSDLRFLRSFENLAAWLHANGMLKITTILVGGKVAAVDLGAVWNKHYTVLAGGTCPDFPGIAKVINFHHLEWACQQRCLSVDFLCGDFNWKNRFHLTPRPLYRFFRPHLAAYLPELEPCRSVACA